eukprot:153411-Hanusia_phi.AAC.1
MWEYILALEQEVLGITSPSQEVQTVPYGRGSKLTRPGGLLGPGSGARPARGPGPEAELSTQSRTPGRRDHPIGSD